MVDLDNDFELFWADCGPTSGDSFPEDPSRQLSISGPGGHRHDAATSGQLAEQLVDARPGGGSHAEDDNLDVLELVTNGSRCFKSPAFLV